MSSIIAVVERWRSERVWQTWKECLYSAFVVHAYFDLGPFLWRIASSVLYFYYFLDFLYSRYVLAARHLGNGSKTNSSEQTKSARARPHTCSPRKHNEPVRRVVVCQAYSSWLPTCRFFSSPFNHCPRMLEAWSQHLSARPLLKRNATE